MKLRPYQEQGLAEVRALLAQGKKRIIRQLPTGGGKTVEIKTICESAAAKGKRVGLLAHRQELLEQISRAIDIPHGWIKANKPASFHHQVYVASVQTLARRVEDYHFDIIIVDEAHHSKASQYRKIIDHYANSVILGFTATPHRLDGKGFDDIFDDMVLGPSVAQLVQDGYLKRAVYYGPPQAVKLDGIKKTAGDYNQGQLASVMNDSKITGNAVEHYAKYASGIPAILFGCNRAHIQAAAEIFNGAGFRFVAVDGTMDRKIIKRALDDLARGRIDGVCSCELISEGVDIPAVSAGIMLRPTQSLSLWLQQLGRCLRPAEGYDKAIILDHAGNIFRHGFAHDEREWSLQGERDENGIKRKRREREMQERVVQCDNCGFIHETAPQCPECGYQRDRALVCGDGELVLVDGYSDRLTSYEIEERRKFWADCHNEMITKGYAKGWAYHRYKEKYNGEKFYPIQYRLILPQVATQKDKRDAYTQMLTECVKKGHKHGRAAHQYRELFGVWPQGFVREIKNDIGYQDYEYDIDRKRPEPKGNVEKRAVQLITEMLSNGPVLAQDIKKKALEEDISVPTIKRVKNKMNIGSYPATHSSSDGWFWYIPKENIND